MRIMEGIDKEELLDFHEKKITEFNVPDWMFAGNQCPTCKNKLTRRGLRAVILDFGARNFGCVKGEFLCPHCNSGFSWVYDLQLTKLAMFLAALCMPTTECKNFLASDADPERNVLVTEFVRLKEKQEKVS